MDMKLELVAVPVTDVDRAKDFYVKAGFVLDHDHTVSDEIRFVQLTPPGSACSIAIGKGLTEMAARLARQHADGGGRRRRGARRPEVGRGIEVSDVDEQPWGRFVYFSDPDGNGWSLQQLPDWSPSAGQHAEAGGRSGRLRTIRRVDLIALMPAFVVAVLLISASPGPAMALIFRRAAVRGLARAVPTVLGLELGLYIWALAAAAGFAALVAVSETAYLVLKVVGAAVLLYSASGPGARPGAEGGAPEAESAGEGAAWWRAFGEGVVVQLANPKAAVFMIAFYPQFVPADGPLFATTAGLAAVQDHWRPAST